MMLELFVAFLQAFIFSLLAACSSARSARRRIDSAFAIDAGTTTDW